MSTSLAAAATHMAFQTIPRSLLRRHLCTAAAAEEYCRLLHSTPSHRNLEAILSRSAAPLSPAIIDSVLRRSSSHPSALRFFVWAGLQPGLRHSAAAYAAASSSLLLPSRPHSLHLLLDSYHNDNSPVSLKTFKVLLNLCRTAGLPVHALAVLRRMPEFGCRPDTSSYNTVLRLLTSSDTNAAAAEAVSGLMEEMAAGGLLPDMVTYVTAVRALCGAGRLAAARELVARMSTHGCAPNTVVQSALIDGACACGDLDAAMEILEEMEREGDGRCAPNVVTYTCLMKCLFDKGRAEEASRLLDRMPQHGCAPNRVTVSTLVSGLCAQGYVAEAFKLVEKVIAEGSVSSEECYSSLVLSLLRSGNGEAAEALVRRMLEKGVMPDGSSCNSLIRDLCSHKLFLDGYHWLEEMEEKGVLCFDSNSYSRVLLGLCEEGHSVEALVLGKRMVERGVRVEDDDMDGVVEALNKFGEGHLASEIRRLKGL